MLHIYFQDFLYKSEAALGHNYVLEHEYGTELEQFLMFYNKSRTVQTSRIYLYKNRDQN